MPAPHEVVAAPLTVYLAPVGTSFPLIDDLPASFGVEWEVLGTQGDENYDDEGVTVAHTEETEDFTPAGATMPTKRFRTGESYMISLNLVDVSPDQYAKVMNDASVSEVVAASGVAGEKSFPLFRGDQVASFAVLGRGMSGVDNDLFAQFEIASAFVSVNGDANFNKGTPVALPVEIMVAKRSATPITYRVQTAVALP